MIELAFERPELCRELAARLIEPLREIARAHGYALGVHGSLARDIDLIAAPWADDASPAVVLAEAIRGAAEAIIGAAFMHPIEAADDYHRKGCPGAKAHGRLVWSFHLGGGPYIDLSVMPPRDDDQPAPATAPNRGG